MTRSTSFGWGRVRVPLAAAGLAALLFATFTDLLPAWLGVACFLAGGLFFFGHVEPLDQHFIPPCLIHLSPWIRS